jgi:hypothetical protein
LVKSQDTMAKLIMTLLIIKILKTLKMGDISYNDITYHCICL